MFWNIRKRPFFKQMLIKNEISRLLYIFVCSLFLSCSSHDKSSQSHTITDLPLDSVKSEIWFPELMAVNARTMVCLQSRLCLVGPNDESLIYLINETNGKEDGYFGRVGQGPEDMNRFPLYAGKSLEGDTIYFHDFNARNVRAYRIDVKDGVASMKLAFKKNLVNPRVDGASTGYSSICRLENGYYVGLSGLCHGDIFNLLDSDLNVVKRFGGFPLEGLTTDGSILNETFSFKGTLISHKNSVFYSVDKFGYMARYDISDKLEIKRVWEHFYSKTDYQIRNHQVKFGEDNLHGFPDMCVGKDYIFTTFSGIPTRKMFEERSTYAIEAQTLAVITHDGKPVGRFKLNSRSFSVALSEDEKYLYVMNIDPEVQIERFLVSDLLEKLHD